jgi:hypothetical protein
MTQALPSTLPHRHTAWWQLVLLWLLLPILLILLAISRFELAYDGRIYPGVQALGVDLSGLTPAEAQAELQIAAENYDLPPLAIRYGDQVWPLKATELGVQVDISGIVARAYAQGRNRSPLENLRTQWQTFWQGMQQTPHLRAQPGAVAAAIASSVRDLPVRADTVLIGEVGLSGELRTVSQTDARLREAAQLGFTTAIVPKRLGRRGDPWPEGIRVIEARSLRQALDAALAEG